MIDELRLKDADDLIEKKLEFARLAAMSEDEQHAKSSRRKLLGY